MFSKDDYIKCYDGYFNCVICDKYIAVFGKAIYKIKEKCISINYENVFIVSNNENINDGVFKFERITLDEIIENFKTKHTFTVS